MHSASREATGNLRHLFCIKTNKKNTVEKQKNVYNVYLISNYYETQNALYTKWSLASIANY